MSLLDRIIEFNRDIEFPKILVGYQIDDSNFTEAWICSHRNKMGVTGSRPLFMASHALVIYSGMDAVEVCKDRYGNHRPDKKVYTKEAINEMLEYWITIYPEYKALLRTEGLKLI